MTAAALYPPAPAGVPTELTRISPAHRRRVLAMIAGLFAFLLLYLFFIAAASYVAYWLLRFQVNLATIGITIALLLLVVFLIKGLFKSQRVERSAHIRLEEADHPELFAFIRRVYEDTGSPRPRHVYVSPEVNAALIYDTSLVSLIVPPRRDLLLGLGLVNVLTLSEFKAVLAHEFGHFAQRSVGLGSYLYVANRVMHDVVYGRDALDRIVDYWAGIDIRISFPAWGLKAVLWGVRKILGGVYRGLNLLHLSLGRQLEFDADNVAVSVTGSDALIHGLSRTQFASECLADAARSLDAAADHGLFSDDLFYHQSRAAAPLRVVSKNERAGLPPELPDDPTAQVRVFEPATDGIPDRYRTHPTDAMREENAKRFYIRSAPDERSPWLLFGDAAALKAEVTARMYRVLLDRREVHRQKPAAEVQQFIDAERAETTFDPKYHGLFDDRWIAPGDLDDSIWTPAEVADWLESWPPSDLPERMRAHGERLSEHRFLGGLRSGELTLKGPTFTFRDSQRTKGEVEGLFQLVDREVDADIESFHKSDRAMFLAHRTLARFGENGAAREAELLERYRFHTGLQALLKGLIWEQNKLGHLVGQISQRPQMTQEEFYEMRAELSKVRESLVGNLEDARKFRTPALTNVPAGTELHSLIVDRGDNFVPRLQGESITGEWLGQLLTKFDGVIVRLKRIHFKSLGSLLASQEKLVLEGRLRPADGA